MLPSNLSRRQRLICGFTPGGCAQTVAWIQIVSHIFMLCLSLLLLSRQSPNGSLETGLESVYCWPRETLLLPRMLYSSIVILLVGLFMGLALLRAVKARKVQVLKGWIVYAAVLILMDVVTQTFHGGADISVCPRIVLTTLFYLFSIWTARCHILDINPPKEDPQDQIPFILNRLVVEG